MAKRQRKRNQELRKRERDAEQMDSDTFETSPEKRAFTVERVGVNVNARGRRSRSHK